HHMVDFFVHRGDHPLMLGRKKAHLTMSCWAWLAIRYNNWFGSLILKLQSWSSVREQANLRHLRPALYRGDAAHLHSFAVKCVGSARLELEADEYDVANVC